MQVSKEIDLEIVTDRIRGRL